MLDAMLDNILLSAIELGIVENMVFKCLWNFDSNMSTTWDTCISGLAAAIMTVLLPVTSDSIDSIDDMSSESIDLENRNELSHWNFDNIICKPLYDVAGS